MLLAALLSFILAHDYQHPDQDAWYASLKQPDQPTVSCCGGTDAYWADKVEECGPGDIPQGYSPEQCALVAIITDDRVIKDRMQHPVGTRIPIPKNKIRKHPSANPTDGHNVIFVSPARYVYCWEPYPLI